MHQLFYQICFYLSKHKTTPAILSMNLNIHKSIVLRHINALNNLGYIYLDNSMDTKIEPQVSKVQSIFSKIKSVFGR